MNLHGGEFLKEYSLNMLVKTKKTSNGGQCGEQVFQFNTCCILLTNIWYSSASSYQQIWKSPFHIFKQTINRTLYRTGLKTEMLQTCYQINILLLIYGIHQKYFAIVA